MSMETPTPQNRDEWDESDLQEHNEATRERLRDALRDESRLDSDQEAALDALRPDSDGTELVQLVDTDVEVPVRTHTNAEIEAKLDAISEEGKQDNPDLASIREEMIDVICLMVEDDEYSDRELWDAYAAEYGLTHIMKTVFTVTGPVFEEMEAIENQRGFRQNG